MVVTCEQVWVEISNYIDGQVDPTLRAAMEEHITGCQKCTAVLAGTRNVVELYGDERMVEAPFGYSQRLHRRLEASMPNSRRGFMGWMVAAAAALLVGSAFEVAKSSEAGRRQVRSQHSQPGVGVPPDMMVVASTEGKLFHLASCSLIHDKAHLQTMRAGEAMREGYTPCVRCLKQYVSAG